MTPRCQREGCKEQGRWVAVLCVPAVGWPQIIEKAIQMVIGLRLCYPHAKELKPEQWLDLPPEAGKGAKEAIRILARGKLPPDFDRAWIEVVKADNPKWAGMIKTLESERAERNDQAMGPEPKE